MTFLQLALDGLFGALFAAAVLACQPTFQPARRGWLSRFTWFLLRYSLPLASTLVVASWFVLRR
jgi:hypothetical protein